VKPKRHLRWKFNFFVLLPILLAVICFVGYGYAQRDVKAAEATQAHQDAAQLLASLTDVQKQNEALKSKLEASAKIVTPDTQKTIARAYIAQYFGDQANIADQVATCESNYSNLALNDKNKNGSQDRGVFQINSVHATQFKQVTGHDYTIFAHDTSDNVKFAKWLWDHSGPSAWVCYSIVRGA